MFWGSLSGFSSTIIQVGAPPYQIYILPQRLEKLTLVGTTVMFFALVNVMKVVPYFALGQFSTRGLATSLVLLPLAVATNFLGIWLVRRHADRVVLQDHLFSGVPHLARADLAGHRRLPAEAVFDRGRSPLRDAGRAIVAAAGLIATLTIRKLAAAGWWWT